MRHAERREIARGIVVSRLGLGASVIGGLFGAVTEQDATRVVARALDMGITYVDTAPLYGLGRSERLVGAALRGGGRSVAVSTKVGRLLRENASTPEALPPGMWAALDPSVASVLDYSADGIRRSLEESLDRLGLERVEIAFVHDPTNTDQVVDESVPALRRLREEGLVGAIGVGTADVGALTAIVDRSDVDCVLVAGRLTLLDQSAIGDLLPKCQARGVGVVVGGVYNSGILVDPSPGARFDYEPARPEVLARAQELASACRRHGVTLASAAVQFPLLHPGVTCVLTGVRSVHELEQNVAAFDADIPRELWRELRATGLIGSAVDALIAE